MNYRHAYHAGNFADVFKHIVLVAIVQSLLRKDSAFCYLDTHAGIGYYDLFSNNAQKGKEYENGIAKILHADNPPALIQLYLQTIHKLNSTLSLDTEKLQYYPGSPYFVKNFLRPQDRIVLTELHNDDFQTLKRAFPHDKQIGIHHQDGYQALKAFTPPKERRGLVLIDPPYEQPDELMQTITTLSNALERWENGIYALWYPIKDYRSIERFHKALQQRIDKPILITELSIYPDVLSTHLNGCGLAIINPPWQLHQELNAVLPWLWERFSPDQKGGYIVNSLGS
jgi:23S rRNA (adenine2030-N6)-methyltransferase